MVATTLNPARASTGYFYVWMAAACVAVAFGGFAPTYWLQVPAGTFVGAPIVHLHGLVFSAWTLLLLSQTWLAANDRLEHHRAWGLAGISLATAMLFLGFATAINSAVSNGAGGHEVAARAFMIVPVSGIVMFAGLVAAAIANITRPDWHKRLMLSATMLITTPGLGRLLPMDSFGPAAPLILFVTAYAFLAAGMIYDLVTRRRVHPAYWWGSGAYVAFIVVTPAISFSPIGTAAVAALTGGR